MAHKTKKDSFGFLKNIINDYLERYCPPFNREELHSCIADVEAVLDKESIHKNIEAYCNNQPLRKKAWKDPNFYFLKNNQGGTSWYGLLEYDHNQILVDLLLRPEDFELYQEPKKAWIETHEFNKSVATCNPSDKMVGAIALAREFLKRLKSAYPSFHVEKLQGEMVIVGCNSILKDLVGEENLK